MDNPVADLISRNQMKDQEQPDFGLWINTFKAGLQTDYLDARKNETMMPALEIIMLFAAIEHAALQDKPSIDVAKDYLAARWQNSDPQFVTPILHVLETDAKVQTRINNFLTDLTPFRAQLDKISYEDILHTTLIKLPYTYNVSVLPEREPKPAPQQ